MGKALKTVGAIVGGAVLVATGVGAIAGLQVTALGIAGVGTMSVGTLNTISAGLMAVGGMLDKPKSEGSGSPTEWTSNPDQPIPFAFGRIGVAGKIVHRDEFGPNDNMYEAVVGVLSGAGPINRVVSFAGDRQTVTFDANGKAITSQWSGEMWMRYRLGAQPDTAITSPTGLWNNAIVPGWTASHRLSGKAHYLQIMGENSKRSAYPMGEPDPIHVIEGLLLYDPRYDSTYPGGSGTCRYADRSTWRYTENGAIAALNWALGMRENGKLVGGAGLSMAAIDVPAFVEAANVADANGWKVAGWPDSSEDASQVLKQLLEAAGAVYARHAGLVSCVSRGAPRAAIVTITGRDTAGPIELDTGSSMFNRLNTIIPSFMSESHGWKHVPAAPVSFTEYVTADGGRRGDGITYRFVPAVKQAAELAAYDILDAREPFAGTVPLKPHLRRLKRGDCFVISEPGFMMDGVKCLVLGRSFDPKTGEVRITFRSETDSKHPLALGKTTTLPDFPVLEAFDPRVVTPPAPGDWGLSAERFTSDGSAVPALVLLGAVANAKAQSVVFEFRPYGVGAAWASAGEESPDVTRKEIVGLTSGTVYEAAVSYRRANNVSERLVLGPVTAGAAVAEPPYAMGPNRITFSDFQKGTTGFVTLSYDTPTAPTLTRGVTSGLAYLRLAGTATGEQLIVMGSEATYRYPVKAGERIVARLGLHVTGAVYRTDVQIQWFNAAGALIGVDPVARPYGVQAYNTEVFGFATAPAGAVTAGLAYYINTTGAGAYAGSMIRPMVTGAFPNQTVPPPYVSGAAAVPGADPTGDNIAAGFTGQGALATLNAVDRQSIVGLDYQNLVGGELARISDWLLPGATSANWSISQSTVVQDDLQRTLGFNGSASGLAASAYVSSAVYTFMATPDVSYLLAAKVRSFSPAKATVSLQVEFRDKDGAQLQFTTLQTVEMVAGSTATATLAGVRKAPPGAVQGRYALRIGAAPDGEVVPWILFRDILAIKAARLGESLVREDGTTILTDGTVVTTLGVAAGYIGQTAWGTLAEPVSKISKLKANGRATDSYQVANGVLSGATLYRNPVYVLGSVVNAGAARITIAAHSLTLSGSPVVSYGGGNINGLAFNTKYNVWVYDPDVVGGAVTYVATTSPTTYQTNPDYLLIDTIVTVKSDGSSGTISPPPLPPGGDGVVDPSCVCVDSWLPSLTQARDVETADALLMLRDDGSGVEAGQVEGVRFAMAHCLRLRTVSGIELDCSTKTPIPYLKGNEVALKWAWECDGSERVAVLDHDGFRFEALAGPPAHIGWKRVAMISADNGVYAAGRQRGRFIFTHNIKWKG